MKDKLNVVITGASSQIGLAIYRELFRNHPGHHFILQCSSNSSVLESLREEYGGVFEIRKVDFREEESFLQFLERIRETDILINAAAVTETGVLPQMELEKIRSMISVNIEALTRICSAVISRMAAKRYGCIVNISSVTASRGNRGQSIYAGTKGYVESFTRSLAAEYGAKGVRVNCVSPGPIEAGKLNELLGYAGDEVKKSIVSGRLGQPEDVANLVGFLCSEKASFINGKIMGVDGGFMRGV